MILYYDKAGQPMTSDAWAKALEGERRVAEKKLWFGAVWISTVWLGMDHDFMFRGDKPNPHPVIFESMAFIKGAGGTEQERYSSLEAAEDGHKRMVRHFMNPLNVIKAWKDNR